MMNAAQPFILPFQGPQGSMIPPVATREGPSSNSNTPVRQITDSVWQQVKTPFINLAAGEQALLYFSNNTSGTEDTQKSIAEKGAAMVEKAIETNPAIQRLNPNDRNGIIKTVQSELQQMMARESSNIYNEEYSHNLKLGQYRNKAQRDRNDLNNDKDYEIELNSTSATHIRSIIDSSAKWANNYAEVGLTRLRKIAKLDTAIQTDIYAKSTSLNRLLSVSKINLKDPNIKAIVFSNLKNSKNLKSFFLDANMPETANFHNISGNLVHSFDKKEASTTEESQPITQKVSADSLTDNMGALMVGHSYYDSVLNNQPAIPFAQQVGEAFEKSPTAIAIAVPVGGEAVFDLTIDDQNASQRKLQLEESRLEEQRKENKRLELKHLKMAETGSEFSDDSDLSFLHDSEPHKSVKESDDSDSNLDFLS